MNKFLFILLGLSITKITMCPEKNQKLDVLKTAKTSQGQSQTQTQNPKKLVASLRQEDCTHCRVLCGMPPAKRMH